jgi:glucokinase
LKVPVMLLAGDIGATKTRLGIFRSGSDPRSPLTGMVVFENALYPDLETIVVEFLETAGTEIKGACFGVAGPVTGNAAAITNLPWIVDGKKLGRVLNIPSVRIVNDLFATAQAVPFLLPKELHTLNKGNPAPYGNMAVIAPGTGLGEAFLIWDGKSYRCCPSEGGHSDFAPNNALEMELLRHLEKQWPHVSYDRICSGRGLPEIYRFLKNKYRVEVPAWFSEQLDAAADPAPLIVDAAFTENEPSGLCQKSLEMFSSILGAEAGNLALKVLALKGVYVAGGLPPRILPLLDDGKFMKAFLAKGRMSGLMAPVPVHVVLNPAAAFMGAAVCGFGALSGGAE